MTEFEGYFASERMYETIISRSGDDKSPDFQIFSSAQEEVEGEVLEVVKTNLELMEELWGLVQEKYWFLSDKYISRTPEAQWKIEFDDHAIDVFNFVENLEVNNNSIDRLASYTNIFARHFPMFYQPMNAIIIDHPEQDLIFPENQKFDEKGELNPEWGIIRLSPVCFEGGTNNMGLALPESILIHELAHLGMDEHLVRDWEQLGMKWRLAAIHDSGLIEYESLTPELCTSEYSKVGGVLEDIPDSLVAYMLQGKLMKEKKDIISKYDSWPPTQLNPYRITHFEKPQLPDVPTDLKVFIDNEFADQLE